MTHRSGMYNRLPQHDPPTDGRDESKKARAERIEQITNKMYVEAL